MPSDRYRNALQEILSMADCEWDSQQEYVDRILQIARDALNGPAEESTPQSRLTEALRNPRFQWRSIESLTRISRVSVDETRDMLAAIGAIRNADEREVYRLA